LTGPLPINIKFKNDAIGGSASNALLPELFLFWKGLFSSRPSSALSFAVHKASAHLISIDESPGSFVLQARRDLLPYVKVILDVFPGSVVGKQIQNRLCSSFHWFGSK